MKTAQKTDVGRIRMINEDRCVVYDDYHGFLLAIVADGMGGHQAGDVASLMAVEGITEHLEGIHTSMTTSELKTAVREAIEKTNHVIFRMASSSEQHRGMGTTVVVILVAGSTVIIAHIGDSRAYLANAEGITQLTEDHSLVNELLKLGQITAEEAATHPRRNWLTRALGTEPVIEIDVNEFSWSEHDMILICSDGLSGHLDDDTIWKLLISEDDVEHKVEALVDQALEAGGEDNITAVLLACEKGSVYGEEDEEK